MFTRHMWIDLEETIINNWDDPRLCNVQKIKTFLQEHDVKEVSIFSFAIWNEKDRQEFLFSFKEPIEHALNVNILNVPTQQEILKDVVKFTGCKWELHELSSVWGKPRSFFDFCQFNFSNAFCTLIDDMVPNMLLINKDKNLSMELVNVNKL